MVRHFCDKSDEEFLCVAESRGDDIDCEECPMNEQNRGGVKMTVNKKFEYWKEEFIRKLKEEMIKWVASDCKRDLSCLKIIDKLAEEDLK